jgi:hypothetical protein
VNAAFTNRGDTDCTEAEKRFSDNIAAHSVTPNPLVIALKNAWPQFLLTTRAIDGFSCREAPSVVVCSRNSADPIFVRLGKELKPIPLPVGKELWAAKQGSGTPFLGIGWSLAENEVRWASGPDTTIGGTLDKPICNTLIFRALVSPLAFGNYVVASAKLTLDDREVGEILLKGPSPQVVQQAIPLGDRCVNAIKLGLHFSKLRSPYDLGMNTDTRDLSWLFRWFSVAGS